MSPIWLLDNYSQSCFDPLPKNRMAASRETFNNSTRCGSVLTILATLQSQSLNLNSTKEMMWTNSCEIANAIGQWERALIWQKVQCRCGVPFCCICSKSHTDWGGGNTMQVLIFWDWWSKRTQESTDNAELYCNTNVWNHTWTLFTPQLTSVMK